LFIGPRLHHLILLTSDPAGIQNSSISTPLRAVDKFTFSFPLLTCTGDNAESALSL